MEGSQASKSAIVDILIDSVMLQDYKQVVIVVNLTKGRLLWKAKIG